MMMLHQQSMEAESRRAEMFQKTLLTMMSSVALLQTQVKLVFVLPLPLMSLQKVFCTT